jgi:hypothetical protein
MSSDAKFPYCSLALRKHVEENDQWSGEALPRAVERKNWNIFNVFFYRYLCSNFIYSCIRTYVLILDGGI